MTFCVIHLNEGQAVLTITAATSTGGDGSTSTIAITHAVTRWVQDAQKVVAYCDSVQNAHALKTLLQAAENVKHLL